MDKIQTMHRLMKQSIKTEYEKGRLLWHKEKSFKIQYMDGIDIIQEELSFEYYHLYVDDKEIFPMAPNKIEEVIEEAIEEVTEEKSTDLLWEYMFDDLPTLTGEIQNLLCAIDDGENRWEKLRHKFLAFQGIASAVVMCVDQEQRKQRDEANRVKRGVKP